MRLKNKFAIIIGGAVGIGAGITYAFAKEGCDLLITYYGENEKTEASEIEKNVKKFGIKFYYEYLDVLKKNQIIALFKKIPDYTKKLDIAVNNAGVSNMKNFTELTEEDWDFNMDINAKGMFFCCQEVFNRTMKKQKSGSIINIASVVGVNPVQTNPIYSVAKAGVIQVTRYLAVEWGPYNVRVNAVSPGWTATEMLLEFQRSGKSADPNSVTRSVPLGRFGKPEEIADLISFLASDRSSFTTGSNVVADGGMIAGLRLASLVDGKIQML